FGHFRRILDEVDERIGEGLDVVGLAAGDDVAVGDRGLIDHVRAGVPEVGADRRPAGRGPTAEQVRLDQQPRTVANRRDWLALTIERADQLDDLRVYPQLVGIAHAARYDQGVEIIGDGFVDSEVGADRLARVV